MDSEVLEELRHIGQQLEKITKLLEEAKAAPAKRDFPFERKSFGKGAPKGGRGFGGGFRKEGGRFGSDRDKKRIVADGRGFAARGRHS